MLKKHGISKLLKGNKDLVITYPDKRYEIVIMSRIEKTDKAMYDLV